MPFQKLRGEIRTSNGARVRHELERILPGAKVAETPFGFVIAEAELEADTARDANRRLLSSLRRVERRTTLRAEWTAGGVTERYFDYVLKSRRDSR